jgi:hypothetical protein
MFVMFLYVVMNLTLVFHAYDDAHIGSLLKKHCALSLSLSEFIQMLYVMILSSVPVATVVTPINHVAPPLESLVIGGAS